MNRGREKEEEEERIGGGGRRSERGRRWGRRKRRRRTKIPIDKGSYYGETRGVESRGGSRGEGITELMVLISGRER